MQRVLSLNTYGGRVVLGAHITSAGRLARAPRFFHVDLQILTDRNATFLTYRRIIQSHSLLETVDPSIARKVGLEIVRCLNISVVCICGCRLYLLYDQK